MFDALITIKPKSVEPERASSATGLFVTKLRNRLNDWKCALIVMSQYYKHQWQTVLYLINNSLKNCAGTNSNDFTTILSFYCSKSHSFQNRKNPGFPGFFFSATRNPGFKILPRIGNTKFFSLKACPSVQVYQANWNSKQEDVSRCFLCLMAWNDIIWTRTYHRSVATEGIRRQCPLKFLCPQNFLWPDVCFKHIKKTKMLPPYNGFSPQNLEIWLRTWRTRIKYAFIWTKLIARKHLSLLNATVSQKKL